MFWRRKKQLDGEGTPQTAGASDGEERSMVRQKGEMSGDGDVVRRHRPITIPHIEENEFGEDDGMNYAGHMVAGACAGVAEHTVMYPFDLVKTRMQACPGGMWVQQYTGVRQALSQVLEAEGVRGLYRGVGAVVLGAIPGHAIHFATYEAVKSRLGGSHTGKQNANSEWRQGAADAVAGGCATLMHDGVSTPVDVVKQRMQLYSHTSTSARTILATASAVLKEGGFSAFYVSYPTTVAMNVPVFAVYFATYERVKKWLSPLLKLPDDAAFNPMVHSIAGAAAGGIAAACSNPLDVVKTRLQTQVRSDGKPEFSGPLDCVRKLIQRDGFKGFLKGVSARVIYQAPGAACCWVAYEYMKHVLKSPYFGDFFLDDDDQDD